MTRRRRAVRAPRELGHERGWLGRNTADAIHRESHRFVGAQPHAIVAAGSGRFDQSLHHMHFHARRVVHGIADADAELGAEVDQCPSRTGEDEARAGAARHDAAAMQETRVAALELQIRRPFDDQPDAVFQRDFEEAAGNPQAPGVQPLARRERALAVAPRDRLGMHDGRDRGRLSTQEPSGDHGRRNERRHDDDDGGPALGEGRSGGAASFPVRGVRGAQTRVDLADEVA